jgi:tetratricopeptide (TPR) repeat protein
MEYRCLQPPTRHLHLLQGGADLRMHQLFAAFVARTPVAEKFADSIQRIAQVQAWRIVEISRELADHPNRTGLAAKLMAFSPGPARWAEPNVEISVENGEMVGRALYEIGEFELARPWFERAVAAAEKGDIHDRIDHDSLGNSLRYLAYCLRQLKRYQEAEILEVRAAQLDR